MEQSDWSWRARYSGHSRVRGQDGLNQLHGVAAPLLAGFSLSLIGVLAQLPDVSGVRWRDLAFLVFLTTALFYLGSLHFILNAGHLRVQDDLLRQHASSEQDFQRLRTAYSKAHLDSELAAGILFAFASTLLLGGISILMVPSAPWDQISPIRYVAIGLAGIATIGQLFRNIIGVLGLRWIRLIWIRELLVPQSRLDRYLNN